MNDAVNARTEGTGGAGAPSPRKAHALALFAGLGPDYGRMGAALSFGQDPRWRRALVDAVSPRRGERVLDVATGTGLVAGLLVQRGALVTGLDQSEQMLAVARERLGDRVALVHGDAERLPFGDGEFDALTFTYLLRYVDDPAATMVELARVVRPGGRVGMVEFGVPARSVTRALWRGYTRLGLPALGRLASPAWVEVGRFLGPSIEGFHERCPAPRLAALWESAGIGSIRLRRMSFGAGIVMSGVRDGGDARAG
jgi:demethylmenaquinone methyltransferase/2-methoxy-6-polyprenyl-1,4-benzoquinol methylase